MLDYIKGILTDITPNQVTVEVGDMGYLFFVSLSTYHSLPALGEKITLYTTTIIREDSHRSYGFFTKEERFLFEKCSAISGIGPKTALSLIGFLPEGQLQEAIIQGDAILLAKAPGIGKKTAERLVIELRDPLSKLSPPSSPPSSSYQLARDATIALTNLGYPQLQAQAAVKRVLSKEKNPPPLSQLLSMILQTTPRS